jgi:uncharacterized membrane protein
MKDLIKYLSSIKKFRNLLLLYLNKHYFYYLLTIIIISEITPILIICSITEIKCPLSFRAGTIQPSVRIVPPLNLH